jgi:hypothetical protein
MSHNLWDSLAPSVHTHLCNPVGPGQFCALPNEYIQSIMMYFRYVAGSDIYTVQLHFITTNVIIIHKYADIHNVNT